jgi:hypothetical protein
MAQLRRFSVSEYLALPCPTRQVDFISMALLTAACRHSLAGGLWRWNGFSRCAWLRVACWALIVFSFSLAAKEIYLTVHFLYACLSEALHGVNEVMEEGSAAAIGAELGRRRVYPV